MLLFFRNQLIWNGAKKMENYLKEERTTTGLDSCWSKMCRPQTLAPTFVLRLMASRLSQKGRYLMLEVHYDINLNVIWTFCDGLSFKELEWSRFRRTETLVCFFILEHLTSDNQGLLSIKHYNLPWQRKI